MPSVCINSKMALTLKFERNYFLLTILIFFIEILIAVFAHDRIVRPYVGDVLVVILIYCFVKSFFNTPVFTAAIGVLIFSYSIEFLQYFNIVNLLGLQNSTIAKTFMGTSFAWIDLLAYTVGIVLILFVEKIVAHKKHKLAK
jgi:hypothetical protein